MAVRSRFCAEALRQLSLLIVEQPDRRDVQ